MTLRTLAYSPDTLLAMNRSRAPFPNSGVICRGHCGEATHHTAWNQTAWVQRLHLPLTSWAPWEVISLSVPHCPLLKNGVLLQGARKACTSMNEYMCAPGINSISVAHQEPLPCPGPPLREKGRLPPASDLTCRKNASALPVVRARGIKDLHAQILPQPLPGLRGLVPLLC